MDPEDAFDRFTTPGLLVELDRFDRSTVAARLQGNNLARKIADHIAAWDPSRHAQALTRRVRLGNIDVDREAVALG